jgi:hypothetical protein
MSAAALLSILRIASLAGSALMAIKLLYSGLYRRYPIFFAYFVSRVLNNIWPMFLDIRSSAYLWVWTLTEPVVLAFYVVLVRELYHMVLKDHRGLFTVGRWAMYVSSVVAVALSALSLLPHTRSTQRLNKVISFLFAADRGLSISLAIFVIVLLLLLSRYPIRLSRNVRVHAVLYPLFFLSSTLDLLLRSLFGFHMAETAHVAFYATTTACTFAWLVLLNPAGEEVEGALPRVFPGQEKRLLGQLAALNEAVLRVSRN